MKLFYSALSSFLIAGSLTVNAAAVDVLQAHKPALNKKARTADSRIPSKTSSPMKAPAEVTDGKWKVLGEGTYSEDFLTVYSNVKDGLRWSVTIEQSEVNPGWYRCQPYISGPITDMFEEPDPDAVLYINATDPDRVYCDDITIYYDITVSQLVAENEWDLTADEGQYGTMKDGLISFPAESFALTQDGGEFWNLTNLSGAAMLALPGVSIPDYSFNASLDSYCAPGNVFEIELTAGKDLAKIKGLLVPGVTPKKEDLARVFTDGVDIDPTKPLTVHPEKRGPYNYIIAATRADGSAAGMKSFLIFAEDDEDGMWNSLGTAKFTEGIYYYGYDTDENQTMDVEIQEHKETPGYFRLVNPFADLADFDIITHEGEGSHNHYMYINATDPDYVYIEASPIGVYSYGECAIYSFAASAVGTEDEAELKEEGYFGKYDKSTGEITFPDETILLSEKDYEDGAFMVSNEGTRIVMPVKSSISAIEAESNAKTEYFNLQGMPVDNPAKGSLVIKKKGSAVSKVFIR